MSRRHLLLISAAVLLLLLPAATLSIGVNYGTLGDNLPPPAQVAQFLKSKTTIDRIKIFDANPDILRAFAGTGISVFVTVPNGEIPNLTNLRVARRWVNANIRPFHPRTKISHIAVGNEILHSLDYNLINNLVPAIKSVYRALVLAGIKDIKVSSPHSMGIMLTSEPPSSGKFRPGWDVGVLAPMLQFLRLTKSPFMVNPYPYFAYNPQILNYADFRPNKGVYDRYTKITYTNMFEAELDAVHSAMKRLGYGDVDILVAETGWPSLAEPGQPEINAGSAADYNGNLIRHVSSGKGTPLMPNKKFETYIFALFNENLKPGPVAERNWGLFRPDFSPVYRIAGVMREEEA